MADRLTEEMIDAYLDGDLSAEHAAEIERRLAHDPQSHREYAALVAFLREPPAVEVPATLAGRIKSTVREQGRADLQSAAQHAGRVGDSQQQASRLGRRGSYRTLRVAAVAASLGLVIGTGVTWHWMRTASQHSIDPSMLASNEPSPVMLSPWMLAGLAQAANTGNPVQLAPSLVQAMAAELVLSPVEARMTREPPTLRSAENAEPASASEPKPRWLPVFPPLQRL